MKSLGKCRGCNRRKLVNLMRLCKKCNKEAHKHLSAEEMAQIQKEVAAAAVSLKAVKEEKKLKEEEKKKEAGEDTDEGAPDDEEAPVEA